MADPFLRFYVSISRGRQECKIFTDDKDVLRDRVQRSTQRQAALDLVRDAMREHGLIPERERPPRPRQVKEQPVRAVRPLRPVPRLGDSLRHHLAELSRRVIRTMASWRVRPSLAPEPVEVAISEPEVQVQQRRIRHRQGPSL